MTSTPDPLDPARAGPSDTHDIRQLRHRLEDWLLGRGIVQWLPSDVDEALVGAEVEAGQWHVVRRDGALVAALRVARTRSFELSPLGPPPEIELPRRPLALLPALVLTVAAACAIEQGLLVDCDWSLAIALISHGGPPAKPMRQPVIA